MTTSHAKNPIYRSPPQFGLRLVLSEPSASGGLIGRTAPRHVHGHNEQPALHLREGVRAGMQQDALAAFEVTTYGRFSGDHRGGGSPELIPSSVKLPLSVRRDNVAFQRCTFGERQGCR
jgi:hypothetical protein